MINFGAIIEARLGSTRLPGKVMLKVNNQPLIFQLIKRLKFVKNLDQIIVATTLNKKDDGPDHPHSMDVNEFKVMVDYIRELEAALGSTSKFVVEEESETVFVQRRGLYVNKDINSGDSIKKEDIEELRPALGILPKYKNKLIGKIANKDLKADSPLYWSDF